MQISIGQIETRKGRTRQLGASTAIVLLVHALMFWGFAVMRPKILNLPQPDYVETLPIELWEVPPEPPPVPKPEPRPVLQPAPQEQSAPQAPATPAPQVIPKPQITPAAVPVPIPQPQAAPKPQPVAEPVAVPRPSPALKPKRKEDEVLAKASPADIATVSDLKLHQAPDVVVPGVVAPSGLTDSAQASKSAGAAGAASGGGALQGFGLKGRGVVAQAMQNHDLCISLQTAGKPIPPNCHMADLASHASLGPKPDAGLQAAVARKDFDLKYKTSPGNTEYWNRVTHVPTAADHIDPAPTKGAYTSKKAQRTMGDCSATDSCGQ